METTIFGAILIALIFIFIYDSTLTIFNFEKYTLDYYTPYKVYRKVFLVVFIFSVVYTLVSAWTKLVFGNTLGLIFN